MQSIAYRVYVTGQVQGVGFRRDAFEQARRRRVAGWVQNTNDGRIEACVEGLPASVHGMLAWLHQGPTAANILAVEIHEASAKGRSDFEMRLASDRRIALPTI